MTPGRAVGLLPPTEAPSIRRARPLAVTALTLTLLGCPSDGPPTEGPATISVGVSIFPVADFVRQIGGGSVEVHLLLPPGANPHSFEPEPRTLRAAAGADLFVMVGGALDHWVETVAEGTGGGAPTVVLTRGIRLEGEGSEPGTGNPHVWLDPILVRDRLLPRIRDALTRHLPQRTEDFRVRTRAYADSLTSLDREIRGLLEGAPGRSFVATHPAWSYFARRYGLQPVGVIHSHPGREPSARGLAAVVDSARASNVRVVFYEAQIGEVGALSLAEEIGARAVSLDPLGDPALPGRDSYLALMRHNARQFARGLGADS